MRPGSGSRVQSGTERDAPSKLAGERELWRSSDRRERKRGWGLGGLFKDG